MEMIGCHINKRETRIKEGKCFFFFFFLSGKNRLRKFFSERARRILEESEGFRTEIGLPL